MTCRQALEQVQKALYDHMGGSRITITDDGIVEIVNRALQEAESQNGTEPRDTLVMAQKTINDLRTKQFNVGCHKDCLGCEHYESCEIRNSIDQIQTTIDKLSGGGNLLRMYKALEATLAAFKSGAIHSSYEDGEKCDEYDEEIFYLKADVELALEKPRRNCDKYSLEEAQKIYRTDAPVDKDGVIIPSFEEWLYMEVKS